MRERLRRFMIGRNGFDQLAFFTSIVAIILAVINIFVNSRWLLLLAISFIIYTYFRSLSKNIPKRYEENRKYLNWISSVKYKLTRQKNKLGQLKDYKFIKCPSCGQKLRVPRRKGKVKLTCPKCKFKFEDRT